MHRIHLLPKKLTYSMCQVSLVVKYTLISYIVNNIDPDQIAPPPHTRMHARMHTHAYFGDKNVGDKVFTQYDFVYMSQCQMTQKRLRIAWTSPHIENILYSVLSMGSLSHNICVSTAKTDQTVQMLIGLSDYQLDTHNIHLDKQNF